MEKIPLNLSRHDQNFLAELCSALRKWNYDKYNPGSTRLTDEINYELIEELEILVDKFGISPQKLDGFYDKFHRAGENT